MQVQNTYTPVNFEGAVKFKRASLFDSKKLCNFEVPHPEFGQIFVRTEKESRGRYLIRIGTSDNPNITTESFMIFNDSKDLLATNIKTREYHRGKGLGELSRLATIIMMIKNGLKEINLLSLDKAILFHSKYKFEPSIDDARPALEALNNLKHSGHKIIEKKAKKITQIYQKTRNEQKLCDATNKLLSEYISELKPTTKGRTKHYHGFGIEMKLTRENVLKNKDFFNALFEKHDIDYKI